jgi:hypothetical protein
MLEAQLDLFLLNQAHTSAIDCLSMIDFCLSFRETR